MNDATAATARECLNAAESGSMAFPQIVGRLMAAGFESYVIDFRRSTATYLPARRGCRQASFSAHKSAGIGAIR